VLIRSSLHAAGFYVSFCSFCQLDSGALIDECDEDGSTALMAAAWEGQHDMVKLLLEYKADVNARNRTVGRDGPICWSDRRVQE
jgi:ankyrin repeat protein